MVYVKSPETVLNKVLFLFKISHFFHLKITIFTAVKNAVRGLLFKFVDFLYSRSEVFDRVIKIISSEKIFFSLSFEV